MWEFIREGGGGMFSTLAFGGVLLVAAVRCAWRPERRRLGFIFGMWATTLVQIVHATWTDFAAVAHATSSEEMPPALVMRVLLEGFKESTRPGVLGGLFLVLSLLFVSIGLQRASAHLAG